MGYLARELSIGWVAKYMSPAIGIWVELLLATENTCETDSFLC